MITVASKCAAVTADKSSTCFERAQFVRSELAQQAVSLQQNQYQVTELLLECHDQGFWRPDYKCFFDYVSEEVKLSQRTVQELMRVARKCKEVGISNDDVVEAGWSKVAAMSRHLTNANAQELIALAKATPLRQLKKQLPQSETGSTPSKNSPPNKSRVILTATIARALELAAKQTRATDLQENLELIASVFVRHCSQAESVANQN